MLLGEARDDNFLLHKKKSSYLFFRDSNPNPVIFLHSAISIDRMLLKKHKSFIAVQVMQSYVKEKVKAFPPVGAGPGRPFPG